MLYINNIALPEDQQSVIVNGVAAEKVYCNNKLVWEYSPYPTCPGYTLYGDYFLSDTITANKNWNDAVNMTKTVTVTKGTTSKTVTAKALSEEELRTLTAEQRKINENGHYWYWTSTSCGANGAWYISRSGNFGITNKTGSFDTSISPGTGGARLGFKNPFI